MARECPKALSETKLVGYLLSNISQGQLQRFPLKGVMNRLRMPNLLGRLFEYQFNQRYRGVFVVALTVTESNQFRKSLEELYELKPLLPVHLLTSKRASNHSYLKNN